MTSEGVVRADAAAGTSSARDKTLDTIVHRVPRVGVMIYRPLGVRFRSNRTEYLRLTFYGMLGSKDARVRRAAYILPEASNPRGRAAAPSALLVTADGVIARGQARNTCTRSAIGLRRPALLPHSQGERA